MTLNLPIRRVTCDIKLAYEAGYTSPRDIPVIVERVLNHVELVDATPGHRPHAHQQHGVVDKRWDYWTISAVN